MESPASLECGGENFGVTLCGAIIYWCREQLLEEKLLEEKLLEEKLLEENGEQLF